jgi:hypothetical protein
MPLPLAVPLIAAGANMIGRFISGAKQTKESKSINPVFNQYKSSPFASQQLSLAKQLFNGRMAGAPQLERNLFTNNANFMGQVNRNATDSSQALALAAAGQGQTDQSLSNLQTAEAQNKYNMLGNLNNAYGTMIDEGDKEYQSMLQKYQMDVDRKDALRNSGAQNKYGAVSDFASMGFSLAGGGGGGLFKNKLKLNPFQSGATHELPFHQ